MFNIESLIAVTGFFLTFTLTTGPFWTALMLAAETTPMRALYKQYCTYLVVSWLPITVIIGLGVNSITFILQDYASYLYFLGGAYIIYFAYKSFHAKVSNKVVEFNWKQMSIISYTNPKVWLLMPVGFLSANYTDIIYANIGLFYLNGVPIFLSGVYLWGMIGKIGAKLFVKKFAYFNCFLLLLFGVYLWMLGLEDIGVL